jgi:SAM-dependent methyltransferase
MLRFRVGESISVQDFLHIGRATAMAIRQALSMAGRPLEAAGAILDFGCGCGRTLLWLTQWFPEQTFYGTDVDACAVQWCKRHIGAHFSVNSPEPPLSYPECSFDLVYAVSVFTHLSEQDQCKWLHELRRILKPGGVLLLSVHGPSSWSRLSQEERDILRRQGFLFKRSSKLRGIVPEWYHTAFHSRDYALQSFSRYFKPISFMENGLGFQDLVVLER